jgi:hypothetical protein
MLCFLLNITISAQTSYATDIEKINKAYLKNTKLEMSMDYEAFSNYTSKEPVDRQVGVVKRDGDLLYNQLSSMESLHTTKYNIVVDNESKEIAIMAILNSKETPDYSNLLGDIEKFISMCKSVSEVVVGKQSRELRMIMPEASDYTQVFLTYDVKTYMVRKMVLFFRKEEQVTDNSPKESPRIEISYTNINLKPKFTKDEFTYERFVVKENSKYIGLGKYMNYNVMSQID